MDRVILGTGKVGAGINIKQMPLLFPKWGNLGSEKNQEFAVFLQIYFHMFKTLHSEISST